MRFRAVLLLGYPGTGKTSVGKALDKSEGFKHYSNGEELRARATKGKLNQKIIAYMDKGRAIPADLLIPEVKSITSSFVKGGLFNPEKDILLLDGLPRDEKQLIALAKSFDLGKAFFLYVNDKQLVFERAATATEPMT